MPNGQANADGIDIYGRFWASTATTKTTDAFHNMESGRETKIDARRWYKSGSSNMALVRMELTKSVSHQLLQDFLFAL